MSDITRSTVMVELTAEESLLLQAGLNQWLGPARPTEELAIAMGFVDVREMFDEHRRIISELVAGQQLTPLDWARALLATEIDFASDVLGAGVEWATVTGISDETTIRLLRSIQRKLVRIVTPVIGNGLGTRPVR